MKLAAGLRRLWLNVHLWLGVALFIPVAVLGLTGTALTFHDELERMVSPGRYAVTSGTPAPASDLLRSAQTAAGDGFAVANLRYEGDGEPVVAQARAGGRQSSGPPASRRIWLDPATARVLDVADPRGGFFGISHSLHGSLMIPEIGRKVVGWLGWGLLISSLTGIWLWWPRSGSLAGAWNWRRGRLFTFNLHHAMGFWISIPLAILAATGVYISFPQSARAFSAWIMQTEAPPPQRGGGGGPQRGGTPLAETTLSIDDVAAIARATAPNSEISVITLPTQSRGQDAPSWRVELRQGENTRQVSIEDRSGAQAEAQRGGQGGGNQNDLARIMRRLHDGVDYPLWWRVIIALGGLAPAILGVTGIIMWLRKSKRDPASPG